MRDSRRPRLRNMDTTTIKTATINGQRVTNANAQSFVVAVYPKANVDRKRVSRFAPLSFWISAGDGHTSLGEGRTTAGAWKDAALRIAAKQESK